MDPECHSVGKFILIFTSLNKVAGLLELNSMEDNSPAIRITTLYYSQASIYINYILSSLGTKRQSRCLTALCRKFRFQLFFPNKSRPTQLIISQPNKERSRGSPQFPNQNLRKVGLGFSSYDRTNSAQKNRDYILYILIYEGRKARHNNFQSEPHSPHFLVRPTLKSSSFDLLCV